MEMEMEEHFIILNILLFPLEVCTDSLRNPGLQRKQDSGGTCRGALFIRDTTCTSTCTLLVQVIVSHLLLHLFLTSQSSQIEVQTMEIGGGVR
jgi:hypothetical protein